MMYFATKEIGLTHKFVSKKVSPLRMNSVLRKCVRQYCKELNARERNSIQDFLDYKPWAMPN